MTPDPWSTFLTPPNPSGEDTSMTELIDAYAMARKHPDDVFTFTIPALVAGLAIRRVVRALLAGADLAGADVTVREQKGLLSSVFTIRVDGTGRQLERMLTGFYELERDEKESTRA
jgi:hypothetical protein